MPDIFKSVGAVLTTPNDHFLLQKRDNITSIYFPDLIGLFGGSVDFDETFENAMCRELHEELNITIATERLKRILETQFLTPFLGASVPRNRVFFHIYLSENDLEVMELNEGQSIIKSPFHSLPSLSQLVPSDAFALGIVANKLTGQQVNPL